MTHLRVEQNTITENVTSDVIHKLYETAKAIIDAEEANEVRESQVSLKGNLQVPVSYRAEITWLQTKFPDLHITSADYAIPFEDPNMLSYLLSLGIGSNGMITESQAAAATVVANSQNTTVTKFNELKYFTNITESKGGFNSSSAGKIKFYGWTALEEVDISNLTSIGHNNKFAWEDTFTDCSSLKKVTASNNLTKLGYKAFSNCQKLDTFTGLEGTVEVWDFAFYNCKKLPQSFFQPLSFLIKGVSSEPSNFTSCDLLESITVAEGTTTIPAKCFRDCPKLSTVTLPSTIIKIDNQAFYGCDKLSTINIPSGNITIGYGAFQNCTALTSADLSSCASIGQSAFQGCTGLTSVDLSAYTAGTAVQCFEGCTSLTSVTLPSTSFTWGSNVENHKSVFLGCTSLTSIDMSNATFIGQQYFQQCTALTTCIWPTSITTIPQNCFDGCTNLESLGSKISPTQVNNSAFKNCNKLTQDDINLSSIITIEDYAFRDSGISGVVNLTNCTYIGEGAFSGCAVTEIHGPNVTSISSWSVYNQPTLQVLDLPVCSRCPSCPHATSLTTVNAPAATSFGQYNTISFSQCSALTVLNIQFSKVLGIANDGLANCTGLNGQTFDFGTSLNDIGERGVSGTSINLILRKDSVVTAKYNSFNSYTGLVYVPDDLVNDYKTATGWSNIASQIHGISELPST